MTTLNTDKATARPGSILNWLVVNPEGAILAVLDSESEAYWFTRNRGHANGAVYFKAEVDYVQAVNSYSALLAVAEAAKHLCDAWDVPHKISKVEAGCALRLAVEALSTLATITGKDANE